MPTREENLAIMANMVEEGMINLTTEELIAIAHEEDVFDSSSQGSSSQTSTLTWINWYCSLPGHDYFCEVHEDFIEDDFNLTGLQSMVPFWREAVDMVLDVEPGAYMTLDYGIVLTAEEDSAKIPDVSIVESSAELVYGLCHQRFILTKAGLASMVEKYEDGHFGVCPRVFCHSTHVLPCGRGDMPGMDTVKLYCPNCGDIFVPPSSKYQSVDGAFFGSTFAPLFFQTYPELLAQPFSPAPAPAPSAPASATTSKAPSPSPGPFAPVGGETVTNPNPHGGQKPALGRVYTPKIYGFKVSERARSGPRMRWLRDRPTRAEDLDTVDYRGRFIDPNRADVKDEPGSLEEKKGRLFDDEDDENDDEEEEEEEEGQVPVGGNAPPVGAKSERRGR